MLGSILGSLILGKCHVGSRMGLDRAYSWGSRSRIFGRRVSVRHESQPEALNPRV